MIDVNGSHQTNAIPSTIGYVLYAFYFTISGITIAALRRRPLAEQVDYIVVISLREMTELQTSFRLPNDFPEQAERHRHLPY